MDSSKTIIVHCKSGGRSRMASDILAQHGFTVYNMEGGINAWKGKFATSTETPLPTLSPPAFSPIASPSPMTSPSPGEENQVPGFEVTYALAAISLIAWCLLRKRRKA